MSKLASDEIQFLTLAFVAISSGLVGTFLILKRQTMLANALSHTILVGIIIAYFFNPVRFFTAEPSPFEHPELGVMLIAAIITGIITSFLTELLTKQVKLQPDAALGLVFTSLFALGILLVTLFTKSAHIGLEIVMGNVDGLAFRDCRLSFSSC